jgi:tetratricopeptide (TPR) repeat protein
MGNHIFISYARKDAEDFARESHDSLEKNFGYNMWLDVEDIPKGANWPLTIQRAITTSRAFLFIISPESINSDVCLKELALAQAAKLQLFPLMYGDVKDVEIPLLLQGINYTNARSDGAAAFAALHEAFKLLPAGEEEDSDEIIVPESAARSGALTATLYNRGDEPSDLSETGLFGRKELRQQINEALEGENARLLLQGFGGIGKTALAAHTAYDWLDTRGGKVLWLRLGASDEGTAFEALAQAFGASQAMASATGDAKANLLKELIQANEISLLVLDDVWNGTSLQAILKGVPRKTAVLATARQRYPMGTLLEVPELSPPAALQLLRKLAGNLAQDEESAKGLCADLGHLAFAIEVAGRTMQAKSYTAERLREDIAKTDKTNLEVPLEYKKAGRESVARLIQTSLEAMPEEAKVAFLAWGAFWSPQITPKLMSHYIETETPESENALNLLLQYGFAKLEPEKQHPDGRLQSNATYRLYDLAYAYSEKRATQEMKEKALDGCLSYIEAHKSPSLANFAALVPEMDNFLGASRFAMQSKRYEDVEEFAWDLYIRSKVLTYQGLYKLAISFLEQAVQAAEISGNKYNQAAHLGNLGIAYNSLRQYEQAIDYHQQSLTIKREIGNKQAQGNSLGNLGEAYRMLQQNEQAIDYYQQALVIGREFGDKIIEANSLNNLGLAYNSLGQYNRAIDYYQQSLTIKREIGDKRGEGNSLGNLGIVYDSLRQTEQAIDYYQQALAIQREIGNRSSESNQLNNLGLAYEDLGDYPQAIDYFEQALAIDEELGIPYRIEQSERNLTIVRRLLGEQEKGED